jgi:hypothetical protein
VDKLNTKEVTVSMVDTVGYQWLIPKYISSTKRSYSLPHPSTTRPPSLDNHWIRNSKTLQGVVLECGKN